MAIRGFTNALLVRGREPTYKNVRGGLYPDINRGNGFASAGVTAACGAGAEALACVTSRLCREAYFM